MTILPILQAEATAAGAAGRSPPERRAKIYWTTDRTEHSQGQAVSMRQ